MPTSPDDPHTPERWIDQILKTSGKIDKATTGTIAAAAGASFVLGLFTGGLGWMPFGAFASVLLHRGYKHYEQRALRLARQRTEIAELERKELEAIAKSKLPEAQKKYLAEKLTATNPKPSDEQKQLPP